MNVLHDITRWSAGHRVFKDEGAGAGILKVPGTLLEGGIPSGSTCLISVMRQENPRSMTAFAMQGTSWKLLPCALPLVTSPSRSFGSKVAANANAADGCSEPRSCRHKPRRLQKAYLPDEEALLP